MGLEDLRSRRVEKGACLARLRGRQGARCDGIRGECPYHDPEPLCGAFMRARRGAPCGRVAAECPYHAPADRRCQSTLDGDPEASCYNSREDKGVYCRFHSDFPDLGRNLREFARQCVETGRPVRLADFLAQYYPAARSKVSGAHIAGWRRLAAYFTGAEPEKFFTDI